MATYAGVRVSGADALRLRGFEGVAKPAWKPTEFRVDDEPDEMVDALLWAIAELAGEHDETRDEHFEELHPRGPGGKFRTIAERVLHALKQHHASGGKGPDPLKDFNREQLRKVAKARGIDLPRGASIEHIKAALIEHSASKTHAPGGKVDVTPGKPDVPAKKAVEKAASDLTGHPHLSTDPAVREVQVENRIREAYAAAKQPGRDWVSLADIRDHLGESVNRHEVDAALKRLEQQDGVNIVPESNQKALTQAERDAAVVIGDQAKHAITIADPSPRPLPGGAKPPPTAKALPAGMSEREAQRFIESGMSAAEWNRAMKSSTLITPTPTPANPQSAWGKMRDEPTVAWNPAHGRPGFYDQVDRVYTAKTVDEARQFLQTRDGEQLYQIAQAGMVDSGRLHEERDRAAYIDKMIEGIREPAQPPSVDPLASFRTMTASDARDALDLKTIPELKPMLKSAGLPVSGRKRELVDRLVEHVHGGSADTPNAPPTPTTMTVGRDVSGDVDFNGLPPTYDRATNSDPALGEILHRQGFDGRPSVVSRGEFDAALKRGEIRETWRGLTGSPFSDVTPGQMAEQYRTGALHPGTGINGNGIYVADKQVDAQIYGSELLRIGLRKDARVVNIEDLDAEMDAYFNSAANAEKTRYAIAQERQLLADLAKAKSPRARANLRRAFRNDMFRQYRSPKLETQRDPGRFAALRGYDAIEIPKAYSPDKHPELIILNRTATVVQE